MAKDIYHNQVKSALIKDGWEITHDPYEIRLGGVEMYINFGAETILAAQRDENKIAVEVKSFISPSLISEFHGAHGQFLDYRYALEEQEVNRTLYLAIPYLIYQDFFSLQFIQTVINRSEIKLLIFNPEEEAILEWIR